MGDEKSQFLNEDVVGLKMNYVSLMKRMWPYTRRHLFLFIFVVFCILSLAVISRLMPQLIGYGIDQGLKKFDKELFIRIAYYYFGLELLKTFFHFAHLYFFQRLGNRVLYYLRDDLVRHIQKLPVDFFNKTPAGRIVTRMTNDVMNLSELFTDGIVTVFTQLMILVAIVISLLLISPKLTLICLVTAPLFIYLSFITSDRIKSILTDQKKKLSAINSFLAENLNGIKVLQLYNRIPYNQKKFEGLSDEYLALSYRSVTAYAILMPVMNMFNAVTITTALYMGGYFHLENAISIGAMIAFLLHIQDFIHPLREILEKYQQFQNSLTSAERIFSFFEEKPEQNPANPVKLNHLRGEILVKDLNFQYSPQLPQVLKNISLQIPAGTSAALVGRTGSGKSTLVALLQKFYDTSPGEVFLDQVDLTQISHQDLRKHVGVIQQDPFLFRGSLFENITLHQHIDRDRVIAACKKIGYLELLERTGRSIDMQIEERGANLSLGERQLVSFARIFAYDPAVLILDEATANIDSVTEKLIQQATEEITKGRTTIIIAHRLSTIEKCDQIFVLDQGQMIESGSHEVLMKKRNLYHQYVTSSAGASVHDPLPRAT